MADNFPKPATIEIEGKETGLTAAQSGFSHFWGSDPSNYMESMDYRKEARKCLVLYELRQLIESTEETRKMPPFNDLRIERK